MKLPKLLFTTQENRRVYPLQLTVNGRSLSEIHIDPHFEDKHPYMSDEKIYRIVEILNNRYFVPQERKGPWEYFELEPVPYEEKNYRLIWCLKDNSSFLGVRHCHRIHKKYDKKK